MSQHWHEILRNNITSYSKVTQLLELPPEEIRRIDYNTTFSLNIPKRFLEKMSKKTLDDPLARQFIPLNDELLENPCFSKDPICEEVRECEHLLHKYPTRALILTTDACAMHCRFCFRRHLKPAKKDFVFKDELQWLSSHHDISEVIFSGGDPLSLPDHILAYLFEQLSKISHIKTIRIHTRFPIGIPERIDDSFLTTCKKAQQQIVFVFHVNHPKELDEKVQQKMDLLHKNGYLLLSQSVLLKGVNDSLQVLDELFRELFRCKIIPYYLHQLDKVQGASHFEVDVETGKTLLEQLRGSLPGYLVPRFVQEIPFRNNKVPL